MPEQARQHFVPQSYLNAWCDPATPAGQTPYVWRFAADGSTSAKKSPRNIFVETDMYTIRRADGSRDLVLEHGLGELESAFVSIRDRVLSQHQKISDEDRLKLCAFAAAARARTRLSRDHLRDQWQKVLDLGKAMMESMKFKQASPAPLPASGASLSMEEVERLAAEPLQSMLAPMVEFETRGLYQMNLGVFDAQDARGFITSDAPCVWFDPKALERPAFYRAPGFIWKTLEVSLPVSPTQMLLFSYSKFDSYVKAPDYLVQELNRRTRFHSHEFFVVNQDSKADRWFDPRLDPGAASP